MHSVLEVISKGGEFHVLLLVPFRRRGTDKQVDRWGLREIEGWEMTSEEEVDNTQKLFPGYKYFDAKCVRWTPDRVGHYVFVPKGL